MKINTNHSSFDAFFSLSLEISCVPNCMYTCLGLRLRLPVFLKPLLLWSSVSSGRDYLDRRGKKVVKIMTLVHLCSFSFSFTVHCWLLRRRVLLFSFGLHLLLVSSLMVFVSLFSLRFFLFPSKLYYSFLQTLVHRWCFSLLELFLKTGFGRHKSQSISWLLLFIWVTLLSDPLSFHLILFSNLFSSSLWRHQDHVTSKARGT